MSVNVKQYITKQLELTNKMLVEFNRDLQTCNNQLTAVKLLVTALENKITAMRKTHQHLIELRKLILIVHPYLKKRS